MEDGGGGGGGGVGFADAAEGEDDAFAVHFARVDFKRTEAVAFAAVQTAFEQLDFGLHGTDNGDGAHLCHANTSSHSPRFSSR